MHKPAARQICILAALFLWLLPMRCAAQATSPCEQARFADDVTTVYKAATESAGKEAADVVVYCDETHFVLDSEGKVVRTNYFVYKVLTQRGAESWDSLSQEWEPWHEAKPSLRARVISEGKGAQWLDQKTINDAPASESDDKVYSDRRVEQAPLPAMAPGVVVEQEIVKRETAPFFSAGVVEQLVLVRSGPVRESRVVIEAPSTLPLRYTTKLLPKIQIKKTEANQITRLEFVQDSLDAYEDADKLRPGDVPAYPTLEFGTGKSWQDVARTYSEIVDKQGNANDVKALVAGLTKGKGSRQDKIETIVQYLSREIRYTGIEFDEAAIVPHRPEETLKRKYGDCKDKATLLVAMLRAAAIPADVALLNVGGWTDADEELPGMGSFDHAIVEVPGSPEYWIDATQEFARLGQLPSVDQGRLALIADPSTEKLKRIPEAASDENRMVEKREIRLAENGPASVTEISEPHGVFEEDYRSWYVDEISKETRKKLADYVKTQYVAEKLGKVMKGDAKDLSKDFTLTLEAEKARRGYTDLDSAVAVIRLEGIFGNLPKSLREKEEKVEKKDDGSEAKPRKERTVDYQLPEAFVSEWDYTIVPPLGFQAKELPASKKQAIGPAAIETSFQKRADGAVEAKVRFDTVKRRFTVKETAELRQRVVELSEGEPLIVSFEPVAAALMNQGKARESFTAWKGLIAKHPTEAVHHLQYAEAFLAVGLGEPARSEAREAVKLEPKSTLAEKTLADILEYDLVGRKFKPGSDYAGAEAAFRAAKKLDADDTTIPGNLAILLEYNSEGERYGTGAKLKEAVAEYRSLKEDELANIGLKNNLGFALFYAGEYSEAKAYAEKMNPAPNNLIVAAETGMNGAAAGIAEAKKRIDKEEDLKKVLVSAGDMVMRTRRYADAADLLEAGANGSNASNTIALAGYLRKAKKHEELKFDDSPAGLLREYFVRIGSDHLTQEWTKEISSRNALKVDGRRDADELADSLKIGKNLRIAISRNGIPADVMVDILLQSAEMHSEGDDATGYRVNWPLGRGMKMFVVKEEGKYKMLDSSTNPNSIGFEILDREKSGDLKAARTLLDWIREEQHVEGGDDPLAGQAFPRMWTKGKAGGAEEIRRAAAAILCQTKQTARDGINLLEPELAKAANDTDKLNISLALLEGYGFAEERAKRYGLATELAKTYPDSKYLFFAREFDLRALKEFDQADALDSEYLRENPGDLYGMRAFVYAAQAREDYKLAHDRLKDVLKSGKAEATDYNSSAWYSLFIGKPGNDDVESILKATQMSQHSAPILHTLGCVYAEQGKTKEAREVLIQAMDQLDLTEPKGEYWYAFGRIAEELGEWQVATADYRKITKPKEAREIPSSSYALAQMRLQQVEKTESAGKK